MSWGCDHLLVWKHRQNQGIINCSRCLEMFEDVWRCLEDVWSCLDEMFEDVWRCLDGCLDEMFGSEKIVFLNNSFWTHIIHLKILLLFFHLYPK